MLLLTYLTRSSRVHKHLSLRKFSEASNVSADNQVLAPFTLGLIAEKYLPTRLFTNATGLLTYLARQANENRGLKNYDGVSDPNLRRSKVRYRDYFVSVSLTIRDYT